MNHSLIVVALLLFTQAGFADAPNQCRSLFRNGIPVVRRIESLGGKPYSVLDVSIPARDRALPQDRNLRFYRLRDVFEKVPPFLGFGFPNVYLTIPREVPHNEAEASAEEPTENRRPQIKVEKVAAKFGFRAPTTLDDTHGWVQSGMAMVFSKPTPELTDRLYKAAQAYVGKRGITCVRTHCRILDSAGFTIGGEPIKKYLFPMGLARDILNHGLELDGEPVQVDFIRTTPQFLEDAGLKITWAAMTTLCRHAQRACEPYVRKMEANAFIGRIKTATTTKLALFFKSDKKPKKLESTVINFPGETDDLETFQMDVSRPSSFGTLLRLLWGPHTLFAFKHPRPELVDQYLPEKLKAFPQPNPSKLTKLKKHFLFSKPVVKLLHSQMVSESQRFTDVTEAHLYNMLRTDSPEYQNKYNLVMTGEDVKIMKTSIRAKAVDWILSKHVLVSDYSDDVRFAGEVWKGLDGKIYLSPNSGTYQPTAEQLEKAAQLLREIFPHVEIVTVPYQE